MVRLFRFLRFLPQHKHRIFRLQIFNHATLGLRIDLPKVSTSARRRSAMAKLHVHATLSRTAGPAITELLAWQTCGHPLRHLPLDIRSHPHTIIALDLIHARCLSPTLNLTLATSLDTACPGPDGASSHTVLHRPVQRHSHRNRNRNPRLAGRSQKKTSAPSAVTNCPRKGRKATKLHALNTSRNALHSILDLRLHHPQQILPSSRRPVCLANGPAV